MDWPRCQFLSFVANSCRWFVPALMAGICFVPTVAMADGKISSPTPRVVQKHIIGPTTVVAEAHSELDFEARVDTGATTTSIHVEEWAIENESERMEENVGKKIRFRMKNHKGESEWLETHIEEVSVVKTSKVQEPRYKVALTLCWNDMKKQVLVTLNDRSHMQYPMLLGRNFLQGDFVVDVDLEPELLGATTKTEQESEVGDN